MSPLMEELTSWLPADVMNVPLEAVACGLLRFLADQDRQGLYDSLSVENFLSILRLDRKTHRPGKDLKVDERDAAYAVCEAWALLEAKALLAHPPVGQADQFFFVTRCGHAIAAAADGEAQLGHAIGDRRPDDDGTEPGG